MMEDPAPQDEITHILLDKHSRLPPTPPHSEGNAFESCDEDNLSVDFPLPPPTTAPSEILSIDKKTPDAHVPRDPRLIRLTGVHPFNVEAPLTALHKEGFLTSPELFYVRNHGAVPQVLDDDISNWEISIEGMVEKPFTLSLHQLIAEYTQITLPVTLVCAGNRRKEQNQVKKSKGFSWGAAGLSTALFTGVAMWDVVERARPRRKARYICMEGADQLPNGNYGTDVKLNWVKDPNKGIMLAYQMNGEMLRPDHGKPLRVIVPGQIGGRSVKWLKRLIVTTDPSENWYHIYDNRVLPTQISPEESANNKKWWVDERYAIRDLSPNSAMAFPAHHEKISICNGPKTIQAKGYAYSGGGRRVTRVELSLDQGKTWQLAHIEYPEDRYRETNQMLFGGRLDMSWRETCFCWCLWSLDIPMRDIEDARDIVVRCMDESMCIQPRDMYWNVLGMMNNPWFRVTITKEENHLLFEHPTQPALIPGGWMERIKKAGGDLTNGRWGEQLEGEEKSQKGDGEEEKEKQVCMTKEGLKHEITIDELRAHDDEKDPWFVIKGEVYNGTPFMKEHPGGATSITAAAGQDASDDFMAIHSETAKAMMPTYHIGTLSASALKLLADGDSPDSSDAPKEVGPTFLNPRSWTPAPLASKRRISSDTFIFTFTLGYPAQTLGLPVGQHLMIRLRDTINQEAIVRAYTPISSITQPGTVDVLIKLYLEPDGKMSRAINSLQIGQGIDLKGPIGKFAYQGRGQCAINGVEKHVDRFVMICAGSGITPIYQVFRAVMRDSDDRTTCLVLNGNRCEADILCREELDRLREEGGSRGEIVHTLSRAGEDWKGLRGRIDKDLIRRRCEKSEGTMVLCCGPEPLEKVVFEALRADGWGEEQILFF